MKDPMVSNHKTKNSILYCCVCPQDYKTSMRLQTVKPFESFDRTKLRPIESVEDYPTPKYTIIIKSL